MYQRLNLGKPLGREVGSILGIGFQQSGSSSIVIVYDSILLVRKKSNPNLTPCNMLRRS
jgi:hypothetical protein